MSPLALFVLFLPVNPSTDLQELSHALSAPNYATREYAQERLKTLWPASRDTLYTLATTSESAEARQRADSILSCCNRRDAYYAAARAAFRVDIEFQGDFPFVDSFWYCTDTFRYQEPYDEEGNLLPNPFRDYAGRKDLVINPADNRPYPHHRAAGRLALIDIHKAGTPMWAVKAIVGELRRRDTAYMTKNWPNGYESAIPVPRAVPEDPLGK